MKTYFKAGLILTLLLAAPYPAFAQAVPALPPSRTCHKDDVVGLWQMRQMYEVPPSWNTQLYKRFPFQYILFRPDNTYMIHVAQHNQRPDAVLKAIDRQKIPGLWQFVVDKSGYLFIYKDGRSTNTQACFIAVKGGGEFTPGEMILMPPEGKIKGRLVKVYKKVRAIDK